MWTSPGWQANCAPPLCQGGVTRAGQGPDNAALEVVLSPGHRAVLDAASVPDARRLYGLFTPAMRPQVVFGGGSVEGWRGWGAPVAQ